MEFFRHCPECGRQFHIKLEEKKLVGEHRESMQGRREASAMVSRSTSGAFSPSVTAIAVEEGRPIVVSVEEFQYAYKCRHCGHEWSEKHTKTHRTSGRV